MIIYGINLFNMVTGHAFTFMLAMNIIGNLIIDPTFYRDCVLENKLQVIMTRLFA